MEREELSQKTDTTQLKDLVQKESESRSVVSYSLQSHGLYGPWNYPGHSTGVGAFPFSRGIFPTQESNQGLSLRRQILYQLSHKGSLEEKKCVQGYKQQQYLCVCVQALFCVQLFATPWTVAHQAPLFMVFSRQEYWSCFHILLLGIS